MLWLQTELQPGWDGRKLRRKQQAASRPETRQWILTAVETLKFSTWNAARNAALLLPCPSRDQRRAQRSQCSQNSIISLSKCILGPPPATASAVHGSTIGSEKSNFAVKYHQQQSRATPTAAATAATTSIATAPLLTTKVLLIPWPRPNKIFLEGEWFQRLLWWTNSNKMYCSKWFVGLQIISRLQQIFRNNNNNNVKETHKPGSFH